MRITKIQDTLYYKYQKELYEAALQQKHRRKITASFDELFELFSDRCTTFRTISKSYGTSHQAVSFLYLKYFKGLPYATGHERHGFCTISKRREWIEEQKDKRPSKGVLSIAWDRIKEEGLSLRRVPTEASLRCEYLPTMSTTTLKIEGHVCRVRECKEARGDGSFNSYGYYRFTTTTTGISFLIAVGGEEFFIIPAARIRDATNARTIYVREESRKEVYNNIKPVIEWRDYKDRWDLLKQGHQSRADTNYEQSE